MRGIEELRGTGRMHKARAGLASGKASQGLGQVVEEGARPKQLVAAKLLLESGPDWRRCRSGQLVEEFIS